MRRVEGNAEAATPQDDTADSRDVGVAAFDFTVVGEKRPEIDVRAEPSRRNRLPSFIARVSACHTRISSAVDFEREVMG